MNMNGISKVNDVATNYTNTNTAPVTDATAKNSAPYGGDAAAVYEPSEASKSAKSNKALVEKLKADQQARLEQMQNLVKDMFLKQGQTIANTDDMWKMLAEGNFTADAQTIEDAKEAISEDGYWGVEQTSQRIFDFAHALTGGDKDKMEDMLEAVKKGFGEATKSWGRDLPDITNQTYDAVLEKFDAYQNQGTEVAEQM